MPTPSRSGTSQVDASSASGSAGVTVPADCNLVVAFWAHWANNANSTLSTLTLGGQSMLPALAQLAEGSVQDRAGVGVAILIDPPTGAQTVAWAWSNAAPRLEGGEIVLVYYRDANNADPYRAFAIDAQVNTVAPAASLTGTVSTDLVVGMTENSNPSVNPTPTITGVTAFINNATTNLHIYDVGEDSGLSGTVTISNSTPDYSAAAAISLKQSSGGGGGAAPPISLIPIHIDSDLVIAYAELTYLSPSWVPRQGSTPPQFLRPSSDVSTGSWQPNPSSPATLYDKLDEASFDDADYIFTTTSATTCEVALSSPTGTPGAGSRIVRWRSPAAYSPNGGVTVTLMQGTTQIAQWVTSAVSAGTTYTHTLSQAEADSITNYNDLRIRLTSS